MPPSPAFPIAEGENASKLQIVTAAEHLFSRNSYEAVSIRDIAALAQVNSALVRYHFGTKEQLYQSLFERRYHAINGIRLDGLRALTLRPASLESLHSIVQVWTRPLLQLMSDRESGDFVGLLAREAFEAADDRHGIFATYLDPSARDCIAAIKQVLPQAPHAAVAQGYLWMVSTLITTITGSRRVVRLSGSRRTVAGVEDASDRLATFVTAGLWALLHGGPEDSVGLPTEAGQASRARAHGLQRRRSA